MSDDLVMSLFLSLVWLASVRSVCGQCKQYLIMADFKVILLASALTLLQVCLAGAHDVIINIDDYRSSLGNFLVEKVDSNDLALNVAEAQNWLVSLGPGVQVSPKFLRLHQDFLLLNQLDQGNHCELAIVETLKALVDLNERATKLSASSMEVNYRLDSLIGHALRNHARRCYSALKLLVAQTRASLDSNTINNVEALHQGVRESIDLSVYNSNPILVYSPSAPSIVAGAYKSLVTHLDDHSIRHVLPRTKRPATSQKKVLELFRKYISEPCQLYVAALKEAMDVIEANTKMLIGYEQEEVSDQAFQSTVFDYKTCLALKDELEGGEESIFNRFKMEVKDQSGRVVKKESLIKRMLF